MEIFLIWGATILLILIGIIGTIIPGLPGNPLIFAGIFLYSFLTGFEKIETSTLITLGVIAVLAQLFDYLAGAYGAKKMGSTKAGVWGAIIGGILGALSMNPIGLVLGIFFGAFVGELFFAGKNASHSFMIGLGSLLGFLGGTVAKFILGIAMIIIFFWSVFV